jgi:hypothetical protein
MTIDLDHREVEQAYLAAGWTRCGAGDWAIALRSPDGTSAARISPFDPTGPHAVALYRSAAHTRQVPELFSHEQLAGGGDLQVMELLQPVDVTEAAALLQAVADRDGTVGALAEPDRDPGRVVGDRHSCPASRRRVRSDGQLARCPST